MSSGSSKLPKLPASASANSAYNRHIQKCLQYVHLYGGTLPALPVGKNERQQMEEDFEFIQSPLASEAAKKYYDTLFREYALVDLTRWRESKAGLRWRTKDDVLAGLGQFTCAELNCSRHRDTSAELETFEMVFGYEEKGKMKNVLVKINVCEKDAKKLRNVQRSNEKSKREKERSEKEERNPKKRKTTSDSTPRSEEKGGRSSKHRRTESRSSTPVEKHKKSVIHDISSGDDAEDMYDDGKEGRETSERAYPSKLKSKGRTSTQNKAHDSASKNKSRFEDEDEESSELSELDDSPSEPEVLKSKGRTKTKPTSKSRSKLTFSMKTIDVEENDSDGSEMSVLIDEPIKKKRSPQAKKSAGKAAPKSKAKEHVESDRDNDSDSSALSSLIDEPQPKNKSSRATSKSSAPKSNPLDEEEGNGSDSSELSVLIDDEPVKKRTPKSSSATKKTGTAAKRTRKSQGKDDIDSDQAKIKKLQDWIVKCGVRKVWGKYLQPYPTAKDKIRHLTSMLKDLGMDGRPSIAKAEQIRLTRELQDEVAAVMDNDVITTKGRSSRSQVAAAASNPAERKMSMKEQIQANKERLAEMYPFSSGGEDSD